MDKGDSFKALDQRILLPKTTREPHIRTALHYDQEAQKGFYISEQGWLDLSGKWAPAYGLSEVTWFRETPESESAQTLFSPQKHETGLARPWRFDWQDRTFLLFGIRTLENSRLVYKDFGVAEKVEGTWVRQVNLKFKSSGQDWDTEMRCYGATFLSEGQLCMLYCGNGNGVGGVGWARLAY